MTTSDPVQILKAQLDAYNSHDLERLLSYYAPNAVIADGNAKPIAEGHDAVRSVIAGVFERMPDVSGEYPIVIEVGEWVAVHCVSPNWRVGDGPPGEKQWIELYHIGNGKIDRVQLFS